MEREFDVELLAPAGSYDSMIAAFAAGADAVYAGGSEFGARAYADNMDQETLCRAIDYAHLHNRKIYLTINTLFKDAEMRRLYRYLNPYYRQGLDGVIVQDIGVVRWLRKQFPDLCIHASTQMTITGSDGARLLKEMGADRIVTARELSLAEIKEIHETVDIEIESFIHGALCYCYSGQCLMSSLIGGRSGNRGRCAQPCRLPYEMGGKGRQYLLSLKDMCTLDILPELIEGGIYSLKIEGRMKSPRYTAGVVSIYRKYLDLYQTGGRRAYRVADEDKKVLSDLFDRGGFSSGYYQLPGGKAMPDRKTRQNGKTSSEAVKMLALKEKPEFRKGNQQLFDYLDKTYLGRHLQREINGRLTLIPGQAARLELADGVTPDRAEGNSDWNADGNVSVTVFGAPAEKALKQPLERAHLQRQLMKTGNTPFVFREIKIVMEDEVFLPVQSLNELRREGLRQLEEKVLMQHKREERTEIRLADRRDGPVKRAGSAFALTVVAANEEQLKEALTHEGVTEIYLESHGFLPESFSRLTAACHERNKACHLAMPFVFRSTEKAYFGRHLDRIRRSGFDGIRVRSFDELKWAKDNLPELKRYTDHNLYVWNQSAGDALRELGAERITLPLEGNKKELLQQKNQPAELIVYGYMPVMISAQCLVNTTKGCRQKPELNFLKDRTGKQFPVNNICRFCYNVIYNALPLSLHGMEAFFHQLNPQALCLQFGPETAAEAGRLIRAFEAPGQQQGKNLLNEFTRGHVNRGVE